MTETEKLVSRRRFKEFVNCGAWEQRKLGEVVDVRSGKDYKHLQEGSIPVYGTGGYMLSVNEALSYLEDAIGIGRKGTIDKPYILKAPFWTVDTLFYAFPRETNDLNFVFDIFQNIDWKKKDESTGVPSLSKTSINEIDVLVPETDEQRIIGAYFAKIDNLITLHQSKVEKIKALKSAYLSEMFPAEGECRPKRRFAGFNEDWEQRKLGELTNYKNGKGHEDKQSSEGKYELINLNSISIDGGLKSSNRFIDEADETLLLNDLVMVLSDVGHGNLLGRVAIIPENNRFVLNQRVALLRPIGDINPYFLFSYINAHQDYFKKQGAGSSQLNISRDCVENFVVALPKYQEQERISKYFIHLDNLITHHQQKLEKLQDIKKAFLNEMFI